MRAVVFLIGAGWLAVPVMGAAPESEFFNRVYLTETEALGLQRAAPGDRIVTDTVTLTEAQVDRIRKEQQVRMYTTGYTIHSFRHAGADTPYRFAIFLQESGQHQFMDLMFGIDADGTIHRVDLMVYREPYGGEVKGRRFMKQFEGKSLKNKLRVNQDVIHIVGATISSHSVSNAARRALGILRVLKLIP